MTEHTPTPWRIAARSMRSTSEPYGALVGSDRGDGFIYRVAWCAPHPEINRATADANAAFIISACNAHDDLVKALTEILEANKDFRASLPKGWEGDPLQDACDRATSVLDAVGGASRQGERS